MSSCSRRAALTGLAAVAAMALARPATAQTSVARPFSRQILIEDARKLATTAYAEPTHSIAERFAAIPFEQYRDIRFRPERQLWRSDNRGFSVGLLPAGSVYKVPVALHIVEDGLAVPIAFQPDLFDFGTNIRPPAPNEPMGFSGFRVRRQINTPERWDEVVAFQGATYFKALAKGLRYGVSARGLAINLTEEGNEEFPTFRQFYIERPEPGGTVIVVHALLDSPSATGAYRFSIRADDITTIDTEMTLFPRQDIAHVGLGTLSSMFLYDSTNRTRFEDSRPAVHNSDGLMIRTGVDEAIFRPLANPKTLQISAFGDRNPHGFGLVQRGRRYETYEDLDHRYDLKPSAWVEPIGDWGEGAVVLVEIPSDAEIHDNIVAFWQPQAKLQPKSEFSLAYRLTWSPTPPVNGDAGIVAATRIGAGSRDGHRQFVVDFTGPMPSVGLLKADLSASQGKIVSQAVRGNDPRKGVQVTFEIDLRNVPLSELRLVLTSAGKPVAETWLYRWTA